MCSIYAEESVLLEYFLSVQNTEHCNRLCQILMRMHVMLHTEVEISDDGGLQLVELNPIDPWLADPRESLELLDGEVKVCILLFTYFLHRNTQ